MTHLSNLPRSPMSRRGFLRITAIAGGMTLAGCALAPALRDRAVTAHSATRTLMGTRIHLTLVGPDAGAAQNAIETTFDAMARLVDVFDHRQPASALARLNRDGQLATAPAELLDVLQRALDYGALTNGAFDVTVKPLLDARRDGIPATPSLRARVDYRQIRIGGGGVWMGIPGAEVTLDGIAKGRVIDGGLEALRQLGYVNALVEAGGDLRTAGARADGAPWQVGITHPRHADQGDILSVLSLLTRAVATSGDYMNAFTADFSEHHIIDPRTGSSPLELASATVLAATALDADALSTTMMVLGAEAGLALAERLDGVEAVLVTKDLRVLKTRGLA
ncbi:MAG TPA: FAD:protein FMN transferase [Thermoflexales bacterium]|nr:FAD:protein FMN transferase [Thermoflexales bacterium]